MLPLALLAFSRLRPSAAALVITLGGVMFLPELVALSIPLIPPLGKNEITMLCVLVGSLAMARRDLKLARIGRGVDWFLWFGLLGGTGTILSNRDPIGLVKEILPGLTWHDGVRGFIGNCLWWILPFIFGRTFFRSREDGLLLLRGLAGSAVIYWPLVLIELRFSPQLHNWVYGFAQHDWLQVLREGGYRPMCFFAHGLALALFLFIATLSGWVLLRSSPRERPRWLKPATIALSLLFPFLKSLGSLVFLATGTVLVLFTRPRAQLRFALVFTAILCAYPMLRSNDWIPTQTLVDYSAQYSQDRAASLNYRFTYENEYLNRALERPWFGWGGGGRNRGVIDGASDGEWVILLGAQGYVGYYARFGLMLVSILLAMRQSKSLDLAQQRILGGVSLIVGFGALDLIFNGLWNILTLFYCGALAGLSQGMKRGDGRRPANAASLLLRHAILSKLRSNT